MDASLVCFAEQVRNTPDGKLDLLGVFDYMDVPEFPAYPANFNFVMQFVKRVAGGRTEHKISVSIIGDKDRRLIEEESTFFMPEGSIARPSKVTLLWQNENIVFPEPSVYSFNIRVDDGDSLMRTHQLPVQLRE
ncbi:MAG: hypothetical protein OXE52_11780 [Chloroflexi bacterium]|nr:hypothetical protein [Chloroflexota bacterium]